MKYYEVTAPFLRVAPGAKLHLTTAQAACRKHAVKAIDGTKGLYAVHALVGFKRGEQLGCDPNPGVTDVKEIECTTREFNARDTRECKAAAEDRRKTLDARQKRAPIFFAGHRRSPATPAPAAAETSARSGPTESTEAAAPASDATAEKGALGKAVGAVKDLFGRKKD